jgi:hypothetical protein
MDESYQIDGMKHIWGILSYGDLSGSQESNLYTMNDFDLTYLEDEKKYILSVETIYEFSEVRGDKSYIDRILSKFTNWMVDNKYATDYEISLHEVFTKGLNINTHFDSIEQAYGVFKLLATAYINS